MFLNFTCDFKDEATAVSNALFCVRSLLNEGKKKSASTAFSGLMHLVWTHNDHMSVVWRQTSHTLRRRIFFVEKEMLTSRSLCLCQLPEVSYVLSVSGAGFFFYVVLKRLGCPVTVSY